MQWADAEDLAGVEWLYLGFADGDDRDGLAGGGEDFQAVTRLLTRTARMELDERGYVATLETVFGQIGGESDAGVEFVFHREAG
jgi:hypothetical protein